MIVVAVNVEDLRGAEGRVLVFTQTKAECSELATHKALSKVHCQVLHGDIAQALLLYVGRLVGGKVEAVVAFLLSARQATDG